MRSPGRKRPDLERPGAKKKRGATVGPGERSRRPVEQPRAPPPPSSKRPAVRSAPPGEFFRIGAGSHSSGPMHCNACVCCHRPNLCEPPTVPIFVNVIKGNLVIARKETEFGVYGLVTVRGVACPEIEEKQNPVHRDSWVEEGSFAGDKPEPRSRVGLNVLGKVRVNRSGIFVAVEAWRSRRLKLRPESPGAVG
ncbi:hypothetical protein HAX54_043473 [Datura stramonium]|uniref:Uncharacterized protein n=1 Tax=Datura stramonium TaxID=4076 RepID=A0ABS8W3S8_DATST|nr:hypothetical protein [Datura stramonium]